MRRFLIYSAATMAFAFVAVVLWVGDLLTRPAHISTGPPPPELETLSLTFPSDSGSVISAWFVRGVAGRGAVLLLHSVRSNKQAMLSRVQFLKRQGYSLLLIDLQAHGESTGERITFGYRESADVRAAITKLRELAPGEPIAALGVSLGGAALLLSNPGNTLSAVVLESVYPTIDEAVSDRLKIYFGPVGTILLPLLLMQMEPRLGVTTQQLRPEEQIAHLRSPVLVVHGTEDRHTTLLEAQRLFAAARSPKELYAVPGAAHVDLYAFAPREYEERVGSFLARWLRPAVSQR